MAAHDKVQTEDPDIGKTEVREVLSTSVRTAHDLVTVTTADAKTHKLVDTLTCTPEHPFRTDGGWVLAGNLAVGTSILTRAGPPVVVASVAKTHSAAGVSVYNFIVQDDHTYFVGNDEEWVHNGWPCSWGANWLTKFRRHSNIIKQLTSWGGGDLGKSAVQDEVKDIINDITTNEETREGRYMGVPNALWTRRGDAMVIQQANGEFLTFLKAGADMHKYFESLPIK